MTQKEFAERVNVSVTSVRNWESGRHTPNADDLPRIAAVLGVPLDALYATDPGPNIGSLGASGQNDAHLGSAHGSIGARGTSSGYKSDGETFNVVGRVDERRGDDARRLPIYRWGSLGDPRDEMNAPNPDREEYPPTGKESLIGPRGFGVEVRGTSMVGRNICDGDVVWVNPDKAYRIGSIVLASVSDGNGDSGMVVKTYAQTDMGEGLLSEYADERRAVVCREYRIIGPVVLVSPRPFPPQ